MNTGKLAGRTLFITGASRGIGKAIALRAAQDGANIIVAAKTAEPHPKLPGTIYTAAEEIIAVGGKALPCVVDVRDEVAVQSAVKNAIEKFGGIDIVVNNASAISLTPTDDTDMKRYDLMQQINTRGTFLVTKTCLPYLKKSNHAHVLNLSPPLNLNPKWFSQHVAYTMAKYGMSMCVLGMAEEFKPFNIAVNALWPKTAIYTAAIQMLTGPDSGNWSRKPDIVADAAYKILCTNPPTVSGKFLVDEDVLRDAGVTDFDQYAVNPEFKDKLMTDFFLDDESVVDSKTSTDTKLSSESGKPSGQIAELFSKIEKVITPEICKKTQALYEFNVTGKEAGKWYIDLRVDNGGLGYGEPPSKADAILTMDSKNFYDMFTGKLKPASAFMMGKLKINGNMQKAMKLEKLMGSLKAHL